MKRILTLVVPLLLAACSWKNPIDYVSPYKIDIQQGNVITAEMLAQLKPGMTPSQVRFILGTPLIVDPFRKDRWDYVMLVAKDGRLVEKRNVTVLFENDRLKGISGDVAPAVAPEGAAAVKPEEVKP